MIFDVVNEHLDHHRVGKTKGALLPPRLMYTDKPFDDPAAVIPILDSVSTSVAECSTFMCGFIEYKDETFMQIPFLLDDEILNQIKEDRMFKLLQSDIRDYERRLQGYDDETYEMGLEISNMVFEYLVDDVVGSFSEPNLI